MSQKVVVITGGSAGIGAALARLLGSQGHRLVLAARREPELQEVARTAGQDAVTVVADVTKRDDVNRIRDEAITNCGHIDVWISNAGRGIVRPVLELTDDDVDQMVKINVKSVLYGMQAVIPHFQERGHGHLINVTSFLARVPWVTFRAAYSAAKAAVDVLTTNLRMDLSEKYPDIHVSLAIPGLVLTDFGKNVIGTPPPRPPSVPPNAQTPEDVASAIASLIDHPRSELYTNPTSPDLVRRYREDPDAFIQQMIRR